MPILVFERGFDPEQRKWLSEHPAKPEVDSVSDFPYFCPGMWEAKQQVFAQCIGRALHVCLIDADIILLSRIDDVFDLAEQGRIVAGCDALVIQYDDEYAAYGPSVLGKRISGINSGLVCLNINLHWALVGLWAFAANYGSYSPHRGFPIHLPGFGDQGILNALLVLLNKQTECEILPHGLWHDFRPTNQVSIVEVASDGQLAVLNNDLNERQRILHCVGAKWWLRSCPNDVIALTEKDRCYQHFYNMGETGVNQSAF